MSNKQKIQNQLNKNGNEFYFKRLTCHLVFCISLSVIGAAFQVGWSLGVYNNSIKVIRNFFNHVYIERYDRNITKNEFNVLWSITNGILPLSAAFSAICSGLVADYFGRKKGLILTNIFVIICGVLNLISKFINSFETLIIARLFSGLYSGLFTGILPIYLSEIAPENLRGLIGTLNQLMIVIGILASNVFGLAQILGNQTKWPFLVSLILLPVLAHIGLYFASESPKYLYINKNMLNEAENSLIKLRGSENKRLVEYELKNYENEKKTILEEKKIKWSDLIMLKYLRRPLLITVFVQIAQQLSGINAVIFYSTKIFISAGLKAHLASYVTIILGLVQLIMTIVCMFIVERAGRKLLLLIGMIGMCLFSFSIGVSRIMATSDRIWLNYVTVISIICYIIFFSIGPGAIPWLLTSEMFKSNARAKANSVATLVNWLSAFIVTLSFPFLDNLIGNYTFILFGVLLFIFSLIMLLFVPETKDKSIDELVDSFNSKKLLFIF